MRRSGRPWAIIQLVLLKERNMRRALRIAVELLAPATLGTLFLLVYGWISQGKLPKLEEATFVLGAAILLAGLPSIAYAAIMELAISRGLSSKGWRFHLLSAGLGLLAAIGIIVIVAYRPFRILSVICWCFLGPFIGAACGLLLHLVNQIKE
jgi:hypothetical protein